MEAIYHQLNKRFKAGMKTAKGISDKGLEGRTQTQAGRAILVGLFDSGRIKMGARLGKHVRRSQKGTEGEIKVDVAEKAPKFDVSTTIAKRRLMGSVNGSFVAKLAEPRNSFLMTRIGKTLADECVGVCIAEAKAT